MTMHRHTFTVEGVGDFPWDMLRYDSCYPGHETESYNMARVPVGGYSKPRRVELAHTDTRKRWTPTTARWESFGWSVLCCEHY